MQHPQISFPQSVAAHTEGNDVRSVRRPIGGIEPILAGKPCIEWCLGDRGEHADRGMDHMGLLDESYLPIENVQAVMVETDDHTTPDLEPVGLDGVHLFYNAALLTAQVLQLTRFTQRFLVGRFNADKDVTDICLVHEAHEFFIVCHIERSLRKKSHRIIMRLLPSDDFAENVFYRLLIADQIVINDEDAAEPTKTAKQLQFGNNLGYRLEARTTTEGYNDVTKLAGEWAAARELHRSHDITVHLQKVVARRRHFTHVGALRLLVAASMFLFGPIGKKLRPGLFGFPHEYDIGQRAEIILLHADPWTADHREAAPPFQFLEYFSHTESLHRHSRNADDVGLGTKSKIDIFDILID